MPVSTGLVLNEAGYGLNRWYGPRVYCDCDINVPFQVLGNASFTIDPGLNTPYNTGESVYNDISNIF